MSPTNPHDPTGRTSPNSPSAGSSPVTDTPRPGLDITRLLRVLRVTGRVLARLARVIGLSVWAGFVLTRAAVRHPVRTLALAAVLGAGLWWLAYASGHTLTFWALVTAAVLFVVIDLLAFWAWRWPASFTVGPAHAAGIAWRRWIVYGPRWHALALRHGLAVPAVVPGRPEPAWRSLMRGRLDAAARTALSGAVTHSVRGPAARNGGYAAMGAGGVRDPGRAVPIDPDTGTEVARLLRVRYCGGLDRLHLALPARLTPADVEQVADALAGSYRALGARVERDRPGRVWLCLTRRDTLTHPITPADLAVPTAGTRPVVTPDGLAVPLSGPGGLGQVTDAQVVELLAGVPVGLTDTGQVLRLRLRGVHVLFAGTTGSGKSSLLWALMHALAVPIATGHVSVTWLDPKGGMDASPARPMAHIIDRTEHMADALETLVAELDTRSEDLAAAGRRSHTPTPQAPHRVVIVDELATLTALAEPRTARRVEAAMGALASRGRGPGYTLVTTTVEPTKEIVRWRGLHAERAAFRLDEPGQVDMVLGDGALHRGADCPNIGLDTPGVCYTRRDGTPTPVRARIAYLTDDHLHALVTHYPRPTPTAQPDQGKHDGHDEVGTDRLHGDGLDESAVPDSLDLRDRLDVLTGLTRDHRTGHPSAPSGTGAGTDGEDGRAAA